MMNSRARWTALLGSAALILLAACGSGGAKAQELDLAAPEAGVIEKGALDGVGVTFVSFGGALQKAQSDAYLKPFIRDGGANVTEATDDSTAKIRAMVDSGDVKYDVVYGGYQWAMANCGKYVTKIDYAKLDVSNVPEEYLEDCVVPLDLEQESMVYDTTKFTDEVPGTMADFFDLEKFPGKRVIPGIPGYPDSLFMTAVWELIRDDAPATPVDIDAVLKKIDTLKPNVRFWQSYAQMQQVMESSDATIAWVANDAPIAANESGGTWAPVWDACVYLPVGVYVPKGSPHTDAAYALINYALGTKPQEDFSVKTGLTAVNTEAKPAYKDSMTEWVLTGDRRESCQLLDRGYWADNFDTAAEKWTTWLTSKED